MAEEPQSSPAPLSGHGPSEPTGALLFTLALMLSAYVIAYPFTLVRYPPITDLPFHAAAVSVLRHYADPAYQFRELLSLHPLQAPDLAMYGVGALLALGVPVVTATKLMSMAMLALVPAGLAVLCHGMRKSPLWGLLGLSLTWCTGTQAGFLGSMGAAGLLAASVGFALLVVRRPTTARRTALTLSLVALFFTEVLRLPFAVVGVLAAGAIAYPATRRFSPLLQPLAPALFLFAVWLVARPRGTTTLPGATELGFHVERLHSLGKDLFGSYATLDGSATPLAALEHAIARRMLGVGAFAIVAAGALFFFDGRARERSHSDVRWGVAMTAIPVIFCAGLLAAHLMLPGCTEARLCAHPRDVIPLALFGMSVAPDLPRGILPRLAFVLLFAIGSLPMSRFVSARFHEFETATVDFRAIAALVPRAPRLFSLVEWPGDPPLTRLSPFRNLPAWIQAERGGALDAAFVESSPSRRLIQYRWDGPAAPGAPVAPPPPAGAEPPAFRVTEEAWFDTFLVRRPASPDDLFAADPTIHRVAQRGTWWLYARGR